MLSIATHIWTISGQHSMFPANATYIAQQETATILKDHNDTSVPAPTLTFSKSYTVRLGNQTLVLDYKGVNHERGNIFIYAPTQRVLMLVDVVFPGWVPFRDLAIAEDVPGFIKAHGQALSYPFDTLVAGHLPDLVPVRTLLRRWSSLKISKAVQLMLPRCLLTSPRSPNKLVDLVTLGWCSKRTMMT